MNRREVIKELKKDGWYEVNQVGSHKQFKHATKWGASQCRIRAGPFQWEP